METAKVTLQGTPRPLTFVKFCTIFSLIPKHEESFKVFYLIFGANCAELQGKCVQKCENWVLKVRAGDYRLVTFEREEHATDETDTIFDYSSLRKYGLLQLRIAK